MRSEPLTVVNKLGLHARAAAKLIDLAKGFESRIELVKGEQRADAKRIMSVLVLEAPLGSDLMLEVDGAEPAGLATGGGVRRPVWHLREVRGTCTGHPSIVFHHASMTSFMHIIRLLFFLYL